MSDTAMDATVRAQEWCAEACAVRDFCVSMGRSLDSQFAGFYRNIVEPFSRIREFRFEPLASDAAFDFDAANGLMTFNSKHIAMMESAVREILDEETRGIPDANDRLALGEVNALIRQAIGCYVIHEVRHISQGIALYEDVSALKEVNAGIIGALDLQADVEAARAYALMTVSAAGDQSIEAYLEAFAEAIYFMGRFNFRSFGVPMAKPWKVARALGLTMMLARIATARSEGRAVEIHSSGLPLDTPLLPAISEQFDIIVVQAYDGLTVVVTGKVPSDWLRTVCEMLGTAPFEKTLEEVVRLNRYLSIS
jgi:hypothetical protein